MRFLYWNDSGWHCVSTGYGTDRPRVLAKEIAQFFYDGKMLEHGYIYEGARVHKPLKSESGWLLLRFLYWNDSGWHCVSTGYGTDRPRVLAKEIAQFFYDGKMLEHGYIYEGARVHKPLKSESGWLLL
ncbi:UNVERIFIED_ASMBLY: minor tail protein [Shigella phage 2019SD1]|uniref:Minor tail protein n=1 Tax=Shigella phage 2019SD1 TaxID=2848074 RepID=A0A6M5CEG9_9CAUD|nr:minor tail protein [Shigella phage 2019SD1]